ncbi:MAG: M20/M25/M40 family metallo-hydrolase, partial [Calditrichota bacterium]
GQGARWVLDDPKFAEFKPDSVFALHNLPGYPLGQVIVGDGVFASASQGLIIELEGATSHAAEPNRGNSPALAVAELINALSTVPQRFTALHEAAQVTVIHARIGEVAFGTSPGSGVVMATLRAHSQDVMDILRRRCVTLARSIAAAWSLEVKLKDVERFPSTANDSKCVAIVRAAANELGLSPAAPLYPFPWSEDFGHFTAAFPGALFGLGAGEHTPALHHPHYDFPDALIETGVRLMARIARLAASESKN